MEAIRILTDGTVKNGHRNVKVKKNLGETISFIANGNGGPWTIEFEDGSPFKAASIEVPKGSFKSSGPLRGDVKVDESFKSSVFDAAATLKDDPDVDIE